jgi:PAS domain-containing protein
MKAIILADKFSLVRADGSEFPAEISEGLLKDADGNPMGFVSIIRDITERMHAEYALAGRERRYRIVSENIPVVLYSTDPGQRFTNIFITGSVEKFIEYTREELVNIAVTEEVGSGRF